VQIQFRRLSVAVAVAVLTVTVGAGCVAPGTPPPPTPPGTWPVGGGLSGVNWTINAHGTPAEICGGVSTNCYPGDAYVDIVGIDNYDHGPSVGSREELNQVAECPDGLTWIYNFAVAHDKAFSVGEWGVAPGSQYNTHGENPDFIRWMHEWFADRVGHVAYEAYFNNCSAGEVESNLYRPVGSGCVWQNTAAGDVYRSL
jgi:hypothetical protein